MELDQKLSQLIVSILNKFGLWPNSKPTFVSFMLYKLYAYAIHFVFSLMYVIFMTLNFTTIDSIINATNALFPTLTIVAYCLKVVNFFCNVNGMQKIFEDTMEFQFKNDNEIHRTNEKLRFVYKASVCFMATAYLTIIIAFIRVIFINDPPELPLPMWSPIDWKHNNGYYWMVYAYQAAGTFTVLNVNGTLDLFSIYVMSIISKQMELLGDRLVDITLPYDTHKLMNIDLAEHEHERINGELIECIKVHQNLIRIIDNVERNFSFGLFSQISLSSVVICSAVYQLTVLSPITDSVRYAYCLAFFITLILQIFMISYFGETILTASNSLTNRAYSTPWYVASDTFRKALLISMLQMQRETKLCAGRIFPINLDLFTTIMKFSYRLYAVLQ